MKGKSWERMQMWQKTSLVLTEKKTLEEKKTTQKTLKLFMERGRNYSAKY